MIQNIELYLFDEKYFHAKYVYAWFVFSLTLTQPDGHRGNPAYILPFNPGIFFFVKIYSIIYILVFDSYLILYGFKVKCRLPIFKNCNCAILQNLCPVFVFYLFILFLYKFWSFICTFCLFPFLSNTSLLWTVCPFFFQRKQMYKNLSDKWVLYRLNSVAGSKIRSLPIWVWIRIHVKVQKSKSTLEVQKGPSSTYPFAQYFA